MRHLILILMFLPALPACAAGLPQPVAHALQAAGLPQDDVAVYVRQVDKPKPLLALNADQPMNPASTMKLLTTYAGLELLGPAYTWKTEFYASAPVSDGVLDGDLIIKGHGDPALTLEGFWSALYALRATGLREIKGHLVLDRSYFAPVASDSGAFDGEPYRAYNASPDALLVNFKATRFVFRGDEASGKVAVFADPALPRLKVVNRLEARQEPCNDWKEHVGQEVRHDGDAVTVTFGGSYAMGCGEKSLELSVLDDTAYVDALFRQLWQELGGVLHGAVQEGRVPAGARRLLEYASSPLAADIRLVNKYSNNVMARQILLTIAAEKRGAPGSVEKGAAALHEWLAAKKLDFPELTLENGAGLSRAERISARHMGELLLTAWGGSVMPELMSSLPVAAVDGTMEHRLNNSPVAGQAHIKTGSLDGVRAMAGYVLDRKGRRWVVVFMANHARAASAGAAQDALLEWVWQRD